MRKRTKEEILLLLKNRWPTTTFHLGRSLVWDDGPAVQNVTSFLEQKANGDVIDINTEVWTVDVNGIGALEIKRELKDKTVALLSLRAAEENIFIKQLKPFESNDYLLFCIQVLKKDIVERDKEFSELEEVLACLVLDQLELKGFGQYQKLKAVGEVLKDNNYKKLKEMASLVVETNYLYDLDTKCTQKVCSEVAALPESGVRI